MKRYRLQIGDVNIVLKPAKTPLKAMKSEEIVPHSIIDKKGLDVYLNGDRLSIIALDTPPNCKAITTWREIRKFDRKCVRVGSDEDIEYTRLECELHGSALGRLLLNCIRIENEPDLEQRVRELASRFRGGVDCARQ